MCKIYQPQGLEKFQKLINVGPLIRQQGLEKKSKINKHRAYVYSGQQSRYLCRFCQIYNCLAANYLCILLTLCKNQITITSQTDIVKKVLFNNFYRHFTSTRYTLLFWIKKNPFHVNPANQHFFRRVMHLVLVMKKRHSPGFFKDV